ncbi:MAG: PilZ domain-containing protein [Deltaproteobacteria bacterium]|nr:PilZ domain-containing protein [Deltaproteobacteria bacterium]
MKKTNGQVERRKYIRFKVKGAYVILRPYDKKLGTIVDISVHGLTCDYFCGEDPSTKSTTLDIFTNGDFRLFGVPCRTISDFETLKTPLPSVRKRRCGVEFGDLTQSQISQLEDFIEKYTTGEVEA